MLISKMTACQAMWEIQFGTMFECLAHPLWCRKVIVWWPLIQTQRSSQNLWPRTKMITSQVSKNKSKNRNHLNLAQRSLLNWTKQAKWSKRRKATHSSTWKQHCTEVQRPAQKSRISRRKLHQTKNEMENIWMIGENKWFFTIRRAVVWFQHNQGHSPYIYLN